MMASRRFGASEESVGAARSFVIGLIVDAPTEVRDSVSLMVSELTTNALIHATGGFDVSVDRSDLALLVSVSDRGAGTPVLQSPASSEPHGRGLRIVDALSEQWGISSASEVGKTVWFRMPLQPSGTDGSGSAVAGSTRIEPRDQGDRASRQPVRPMTTNEGSQAGTASSRHLRPGHRSRVRPVAPTPRRRRMRSTQ